jgi:hypothetical protein
VEFSAVIESVEIVDNKWGDRLYTLQFFFIK